VLIAKDVFTVKESLRNLLPVVFEDYQDLRNQPLGFLPTTGPVLKAATVSKIRGEPKLHSSFFPQLINPLAECVCLNFLFLLEIFLQHHYSQLLRFLLENVALNWHPAFPEVEQKLLFDDFFLSADQGSLAVNCYRYEHDISSPHLL
jgi:hypothetical protein